MRTRVYPVILYVRTVILGPKKPISQLRILKKKILKEKKAPTSRANHGFFAKLEISE